MDTKYTEQDRISNSLAALAKAGDQTAKEKLYLTNKGLIVYLAQKYQYRAPWLTTRDLVQHGSIGMMMALDRYDPNHDVGFMGYAKSHIKGSILGAISLPLKGAGERKFFFHGQRAEIALHLEGKELTPEIVAERLKVSVGSVTRTRAYLGQPIPLPEDDDFRHDVESAESILICKTTEEYNKKLIHEAVLSLDPRERAVINQTFLSESPKSLKQIGKRLGFTGETMGVARKSALKELRVLLEGRLA